MEIPWHGKLSLTEDQCPHCKTSNEYSEDYITVMELSAQVFKICIKCKGKFVDTYLIDFGEDDGSHDEWEQQARYDDPEVYQAELFEDLMGNGFLTYDDQNPNEDKDYYDIPPKSVHFIKGDDDEES